jgi:hypothetical protein
MQSNNRRPYYLPRHPFLMGMAMTLDLGGTLLQREAERSRQFNAFRALEHDWLMIGDDLRAAIKAYERQIDESSSR